MEKRGTLEQEIAKSATKFLEQSKDKEVLIISHFDTDGISSAAIMIKALRRKDQRFSVKILKRLEETEIPSLPKDKLILFLDLASGSLDEIANSGLEDVFIIDHHEIAQNQEVPENVIMINPELHEQQKISASGLTYLFSKELSSKNKELAKLAVLGMIGDCLDNEIGKLNHNIVTDSEVVKKRGLLIFPSTRPLNRVLEFSSNPYIPGVTGNIKGVLELLREANLNPGDNGYPSLIELNVKQMEQLVTSIILRHPKANNREIIGDIFLIKFFNKLEDAREISAKINACSKLGESGVALQLCLEISKVTKKAESIHVKYRQKIISALKLVTEGNHIKGDGYLIVNSKEEISDTMIGTIMSILSNSMVYEKGMSIIGMAYYDDKIKVSARSVGRTGRNLRELLTNALDPIGGEVGGHQFAAGCMLPQAKEQEFIDSLKKNLEIEMVKI